jgi:hypothetical protein
VVEVICVKGWVVWVDFCGGLLLVELVTGAGTAVLMGFTAADAGVCAGVCRFGNGAEDGVWLAG